MMSFSRVALVFAIIAGILGLGDATESKTWHVRQDGSGDAPSIQAAVDSSRAGDSILVAPGIYTQENVIIDNKDSLTIRSEQGPGQTFLHTVDYEIAVVYSSEHVTIEGFTFENSPRYAIGAGYAKNLILQGNVVRYAAESAILLSRSTSVIIRENLIYSNGGNGIHCVEMSSGYIYGNTISHNVGGDGILLDDVGCSVVNNVITYNKAGVVAFEASFSCNNVYGNDTNYALVFVPDPTGTNGNIALPPLFCGVDPASSGNYYLQQNSPCAPGNHPDDPSCGLIGRYEVGCGNTAVKKASWGEIKAFVR